MKKYIKNFSLEEVEQIFASINEKSYSSKNSFLTGCMSVMLIILT
jgi:hypothetical protein